MLREARGGDAGCGQARGYLEIYKGRTLWLPLGGSKRLRIQGQGLNGSVVMDML